MGDTASTSEKSANHKEDIDVKAQSSQPSQSSAPCAGDSCATPCPLMLAPAVFLFWSIFGCTATFVVGMLACLRKVLPRPLCFSLLALVLFSACPSCLLIPLVLMAGFLLGHSFEHSFARHGRGRSWRCGYGRGVGYGHAWLPRSRVFHLDPGRYNAYHWW